MNVYHYIASSSPDNANKFCKKYGYYQIENINELEYCLQTIIANKGETVFKEMMDLHPDKDVVLELFEKKCEQKPCPTCESNMLNANGMANANANANAITNANGFANQTNIIILISAMIVAISVISIKK